MGNLTGRDPNQQSLLGGPALEEAVETKMLFITNKRNLLSFLGAGMVVPSDLQFRYKKDSREIFNGAIGIWKNGLPDLSTICPEGEWGEFVFVEFDEDLLTRFSGHGLVYSDDEVMAFNGPLPISTIKSIVFETREDMEDFLVRLPEDVVVDRSLFITGDLSGYQKSEAAEKYDIEESSSPAQAIKTVDRLGGALRVIDVLAPDNPRAIDYSRALTWNFLEQLGFTKESSNLEDAIVSVSVEDKVIVNSLIEVLSDQYPEEGIDHNAVLEQIENRLHGTEGLDLKALETWLAFSRKVLEAERDVPELGDGGDIIKRGVLLFLLRPSLDRLAKSKLSSIRPGDAVFVVALFLAGYFSGLVRLGPVFKTDIRRFNKYVSDMLEAFWCGGIGGFSSRKEVHKDGGVSVVLVINDVPVWERKVEKNALLAYVLQKARIVGYELDYDFKKHRLVYNKTLEGDRKQTVYLELISSLKDGTEVLRFISPCQDISGQRKNKMKKADLQKILEMNSHRDMYCSFAFSDELEAVVVQAVQIVRTMDDIEFEMLINEVAKAADEYERDVLSTDVY